MTLEGYDYTNVAPSVLKADGAKFAMRYLGTSSKCITVAEKNQLQADGVGIGLVYETSGVDFSGGERAGLGDGSAAKTAALKLGAPAGMPIYFAIDTDTNEYTLVDDYLKGCSEACGPYVAKVYGSFNVVENAPGSGHWQTYAWSNGRVSAKADLYQYLNGAAMDHDRTLGSTLSIVDGWLVPGAPITPVPVPTPTPPPVEAPMTAVARAKAEEAKPSQDWHDLCLKFVRTMFGLAADGREARAVDSWTDCPADKRHSSEDGKDAPADTPFVFSGGAGGAGHIVVMKGDGEGGCYSSDWPNNDGKVGETTVDDIRSTWTDLKPLGWMEELEGVVVHTPVPAPPIPVPVHPPVAGGNGDGGTFTNFPGSAAFKFGHADPAVWVLGVRLQAAGYGKHFSHGKKAYAPSHVFSFHDWQNVKFFQEAQGWTGANADGFPGPATWAHLGMASNWRVA